MGIQCSVSKKTLKQIETNEKNIDRLCRQSGYIQNRIVEVKQELHQMDLNNLQITYSVKEKEMESLEEMRSMYDQRFKDMERQIRKVHRSQEQISNKKSRPHSVTFRSPARADKGNKTQ